MIRKVAKIKADPICLHDETFDTDQDMKLFDPNEPWKKTTLPGGSYTMKEMLVPVICQGKRVYDTPACYGDPEDLQSGKKETLWEENKRFTNPSKIHVDLSQKLYDMKQSLLSEMSR